MLKKETISLLNSNNINFKDVFSICIGKTFLNQKRFSEYLGDYKCWNTDLKEGILKIDDRIFDVEYIGTTSVSDNLWYFADLEQFIEKQYVELMLNTRKIMQNLNLQDLIERKIELNNDINGYKLSVIYIAFAPENVSYFCGSGDVSIYMFVKNLPDHIFQKMNSVEFSNYVMEIISMFDVNHKLMVKALLTEEQIEYTENQNNIIAKFNDNSILTVEFDKDNLLIKVSGNLSL